jgi:hypothetical protein
MHRALTPCRHGDDESIRIARLERNGSLMRLEGKYEEGRLQKCESVGPVKPNRLAVTVTGQEGRPLLEP